MTLCELKELAGERERSLAMFLLSLGKVQRGKRVLQSSLQHFTSYVRHCSTPDEQGTVGHSRGSWDAGNVLYPCCTGWPNLSPSHCWMEECSE